MKDKKSLSPIRKLLTANGRLRVWIIPMVLLLICGVLTVGGVRQLVSAFRYNRTQLSQDPNDLGINMNLPDGITSIALFGIDARNNNFKGLSDSIMIITADAEHNSIKLISVMRDSLVKVDGYGYQKINAAYSLGGPQLAIKTLNQTFGLNIRNYATVDFVSMAGLIDVVGGIEAELTASEVKNANVQIKYMNIERGTKLDYIEEAGKQTLNGIQAVAFSRVRYVATVNGTRDDFGRTERQRLVMEQLFRKALEMDIKKYPAMIRTMMPYMETSLSYGDIFDLAGILTSEGLSFKQARIPADKAVINDGLSVRGLGSCLYYNLDYAAKLINAFIYDDISFEDYMEANGVDRTGWYAGAVSSSPSGGGSGTTKPEPEKDPVVTSPVEEEPNKPDIETPDSTPNEGEEQPPEEETSNEEEPTPTPPEEEGTDPPSGGGTDESGDADTPKE